MGMIHFTIEEQKRIKDFGDSLKGMNELLGDAYKNGNHRHLYWILDESKNPIPATMPEFSVWIERDLSNRRVAETYVGKYRVSTVFLGIDHSFSMDLTSSPILFETMVFTKEPESQDDNCGRCERTTTWQLAELWHERIVKELRDELENKVDKPSEPTDS